MESVIVKKIWLTETAIWIQTEDGKVAHENFNDYQRLKYATPEQRANYSSDKFGIHWEELDEDLCFEGFFQKKSANTLYSLFTSHPELNASAIARRLGISQSLFAQYVSGSKKPSTIRYREIIETIRSIGRELASLPIESKEAAPVVD